MKRNIVFILLLVLAIALVALALQMSAKPRLKYMFAKPTTYAQCVEATGVILESYPTRCVYKDQSFTNPDQTAEAPPSAQVKKNLKTYQDTGNKFSFQYEPEIFTEGRVQEKLPWKDKSIDSVLFVHTVPIQHCDLSGLPDHCTDTTTDISLAFTPLEASLADIVSSAKAKVGGFVDITIGKTAAKTFSQGVEGEGNIYYLLPVSATRTLMITRSFINEDVVGGYKNQKGFIPFDQQEKVFNELAATLSINN